MFVCLVPSRAALEPAHPRTPPPPSSTRSGGDLPVPPRRSRPLARERVPNSTSLPPPRRPRALPAPRAPRAAGHEKWRRGGVAIGCRHGRSRSLLTCARTVGGNAAGGGARHRRARRPARHRPRVAVAALAVARLHVDGHRERAGRRAAVPDASAPAGDRHRRAAWRAVAGGGVDATLVGDDTPVAAG